MNASIKLEDGKFEFHLKDGYEVTCDRNGEPWKNYLGDKAVYLLFLKALEAEKLLSENEELKRRISSAEYVAKGMREHLLDCEEPDNFILQEVASLFKVLAGKPIVRIDELENL